VISGPNTETPSWPRIQVKVRNVNTWSWRISHKKDDFKIF
jgi:hypothetical protein